MADAYACNHQTMHSVACKACHGEELEPNKEGGGGGEGGGMIGLGIDVRGRRG